MLNVHDTDMTKEAFSSDADPMIMIYTPKEHLCNMDTGKRQDISQFIWQFSHIITEIDDTDNLKYSDYRVHNPIS